MKECSFCGNLIKEDELFLGLSGSICRDCVSVCNQEMADFVNLEKIFSLESFRPHIIKRELDKYVIGQEEAKKMLSVAVYNHYKKINIESDVEIQKTNILMQGPTGCGKTYIIETLTKILNVPLVIVDATTFTEAGYVGEDVDFIIEKLLLTANGDVEKAEKGIVYIDEIDKIAKQGHERGKKDASGEGVQQALLKILENGEVTISLGNKFSKKEVIVNTSKILFVVGGAFVGIEDAIKSRNPRDKRVFGFDSGNKQEEKDDFENELIHDDLVKFGLIPEFVGRFPVITTLDYLKKDDFIKILTEPNNAIIKQYIALFKADGVDLEFNNDAINYIVEEAMKKKIGARGLKSIIEKNMYQLMYDIPQQDIKKIVITREVISSKKAIAIDKKTEA